jgi:hypothetical protein
MTNVKPLLHTPSIDIAWGQSHDMVGKGSVNVETPSGGIKGITNTLYVLGLKKNLLSIGKVASQGYMFDAKQCLVIHKQDH